MRAPASFGSVIRMRLATSCADALRSFSGLRRTNVWALLTPRPPPMNPATLWTAGSARMCFRYTSIFGCITWNDVPSSPRMKPLSCPVSWLGRKLFGATM